VGCVLVNWLLRAFFGGIRVFGLFSQCCFFHVQL
jgi:hypothetical protein